MKNPILTILTPTYNRKHLLGRLHASLVAQDMPPGSFEWLVVDDGSTDGTADYVRGLQKESDFKILVLEQPNGGKHRAVNLGAKYSSACWVVIIDSDDWILPDGLSHVLGQINIFQDDMETRAVIFPHQLAHKGNGKFTLNNHAVNFSDWMRNDSVGDTTIVMRREVLLKYPFFTIEGENFIAESSAFSRMFRNGGIRLSNEKVVTGEYLADGLSVKSLQLRINNPVGAVSTYYEHLNSMPSIKRYIISMLNYHRFYWHALNRGADRQNLPGQPKFFWNYLGRFLYLSDNRKCQEQDKLI